MKKFKINHKDTQGSDNREQDDFGKLIKDAFRDLQENALAVGKPLGEMEQLVAMAEKFKMSNDRAVIFAAVYCMSSTDIRLTERYVVSFLKPFFQDNCKLIRNQLREMQRLGFVEKERYEGLYVYSVESKIVEAIDNNDADAICNVGPIGLDAVLQYFKKKLLDHDHLGKTELNQYMDDIVENNGQLNLIRYCNKKHFVDTLLDAYVCIAVCVKSVFDNDTFNFSYMDNYINMGKSYIQYMRREILNENWEPISEGLIENAGGDIVDFNPELRLTPKGFDFFLRELDPDMLHFLRARFGKVNIPLILPKNIEKVDLHFNPDFRSRIDRMSTILMPQKFADYQASFPKNAKMKGLTILLHGAPGTGKTQLVLNLSKLTKRPIMKIDITMVLDKWVGNSEKNLLNIFKNHKTACERMEVAPILFLNECDQILGKRIGIRNSVDSMNNALQNILLEQMEQFDGIMIGSTNNTNNIDEAFERRFTMKFEFESPNELAMISIWKSSIKGLRQNEARELVKQFKFSGGEISNVARRFMLENLLGLQKSRLQTLIELCNTERYQNNKTSSIGFSVEKSKLTQFKKCGA
jgi:hypothetical protein